MIQPHLIYCNIIWGGASMLALNKLVTLQKRALRLITCSYFRAPSDPLFVKFSILKLLDLHKVQIFTFMYKFIHKLLPDCCMHYIQLCTNTDQYFLRQRSTFNRQTFRTLLRKKCISIMGLAMWENLPSLIKESISLAVFKRRLLDFLLSQYVISA